ncbi:MAG: translation initiation factor IF-2 [Patescibacteria group bacterium UBA2163]
MPKTPTSKKRVQPVVAVVGHIDHGKTSLLDYIRKAKVAEGETGGITQGISAYELNHTPKEGAARAISFIDTPGHEAFQEMRRRGASAADIAILVVAADDGVKPQTIEAWNAITKADIPYIVAFTKIDKENANLNHAKETVMKEGIYLEGLGGSVPHVAVSSKTGEGIDELLDIILLVTDLEDIHCDTSLPPRAVVIESSRDPKSGVAATVVVRDGTFSAGSFAVADDAFAPLRIIENTLGEKVKEISCGQPAKIIGFSKEPRVGSEMYVVKSKKEAEAAAAAGEPPLPAQNVHDAQDTKKPIRIILKADTAGSIEALQYELDKMPQENARLIIADIGVGAISENDVKQLVGFEDSIIAGFNVKVDSSAKDLAERNNVRLESKEIIYELVDWLHTEVERIAPKEPEIIVTGNAKILKHFSTTGSKHVVGGRVESGTIERGASVIIKRRDIDVGHGKVLNVQTQKSDVSSVSEGAEFGAQIESKADITGGDYIETRTKES